MIEPVPVVSDDDNPLTCLSAARYTEECRFVTASGPGPEEKVMRRLAAGDGGVLSIDLDLLACPYLPICDPIVGGAIVRVDGNHLTQSFARTLIDPIDRYLVSQGVLSEAR